MTASADALTVDGGRDPEPGRPAKEIEGMAKAKTTGKTAASNASKTLRDRATSEKSKSAAGSALSQTKAPGKTTSKSAAHAASEVVTDGRTSKTSKSAAGSALSQSTSKKKSSK